MSIYNIPGVSPHYSPNITIFLTVGLITSSLQMKHSEAKKFSQSHKVKKSQCLNMTPNHSVFFQLQYSIFMITVMAMHCFLFSFKPQLTSPLTKFLSYWTKRARAYSLQVISLLTFHYSKTLVKCLYH